MPKTNEVNLGIGNVSGCFFHAPAGTALPTKPSEELAAAWKNVGYVSEDGITWNTGMTFDTLKDWARQIVRTLPGEDDATVAVPVISTTAESLKTVFGADNVTVTEATASAGELIKVAVKKGIVIPGEAFLFLMKDGDDLMMLGTTEGFVSEIGELVFAPGEPINWNATISASVWIFAKETALEADDSSED